VSSAPFTIGAERWNGGAKLAEECSELIQVLMKLIAFPDNDYPEEGTDLAERLIEEIGDLEAAIDFFKSVNFQVNDYNAVYDRKQRKLKRFKKWDRKER
jgi:hypothetical protein